MRWTIRTRLTIWYSGLLLLILAVLGVSLFQILGHSLRSQAENSVIGLAKQIQASIEPQSDNQPVEEATEDGSQYEITDSDLVAEYGAPGTYIEIRDASNGILLISPELRGASLSGASPESPGRTLGSGFVETVDIPQIGPVLVYSQSLNEVGHPQATLLVGKSTQYIEDALTQLRSLLLLLSGVAVLVSAGGAAILAQRALAPIDRITKTARRITTSDLHQRLGLTGPDDEVSRLGKAFDDMLERVEDGFEREKRFSADVAHELRTPLTILKGTTEVALRGRDQDPHALGDALEVVREETDRMVRLVEGLLLLGQSESGELPLSLREVPLSLLIHRTIASFSPAAEEKGIALGTDRVQEVSLAVDEDWIVQLLANLVSNAIRYTREGGHVSLGLRVESLYAVITVRDSGIGIPEEDLPHVFERFYRPDAARSRRSGGTGLGLAIVHAIVQAHKGRIDVTSKVGEGTAFHVRLPMSRFSLQSKKQS
jgi:heavy metal sensor kinase